MDTNNQIINRSGHWKALNSPFILLVTGFICTTMLGGLLTYTLNRLAKERDMRLAAQFKTLSLEQETRIRQQEVRFERLHEERASTIKALYGELVDLRKDLYNLLYNWRPIGIAPEQVNPIEVITSVRKYKQDVEKSKIYFDTKVCSVLDSVCEALESTMKAFEGAMEKEGYPWKTEAPDFTDIEWEKVKVISNEVQYLLTDEFRELLGVIE